METTTINVIILAIGILMSFLNYKWASSDKRDGNDYMTKSILVGGWAMLAFYHFLELVF